MASGPSYSSEPLPKHASILGFLSLTMIVLALALNACNAPKQTSIPSSTISSSATPFDGYGIYESCSSKNAAICLSHLNNMAAAGFKLVIDYDEMYGDASFQKAYLDRAQSVGMKVIVALNNPAFYLSLYPTHAIVRVINLAPAKCSRF